MNVLVTGGAGFIGSHIVDLLVWRGHSVTVLDDLSSGSLENLRGSTASLINESVLDWDGKVDRYDVICHQAAQPSLARSLLEPSFDALVNVVGTVKVIELARKWGAHIVFASTGAVYSRDSSIPFSEESEVRPMVPYGVSKLSAENYLRVSGLPFTVLRYGNVFGPRQISIGENQVIPRILSYLLNGYQFRINGDGEQLRDFVFVEDVASANVLAMGRRVFGLYNCGTGVGTSVNQVYQLAQSFVEIRPDPPSASGRPSELRAIVLNSERARRYLDWSPQVSLEDGIRRTIEHWRSS